MNGAILLAAAMIAGNPYQGAIAHNSGALRVNNAQVFTLPIPNANDLGRSLWGYPSLESYWMRPSPCEQTNELLLELTKAVTRLADSQDRGGVALRSGSLTSTYCGRCHTEQRQGDFQIDVRSIDPLDALQMRRMIRGGQMPPQGSPERESLTDEDQIKLIDEILDLIN